MSVATAHSHPSYSFQPSWDETIVPTLRKRLESESIALSKRISAISLSSSDDFPTQHSYASNHTSSQDTVQYTSRHGSNFNKKPSAIPRPSLQISRNTNDEAAGPSNTAKHQSSDGRPVIRQRTYSQPYVYEEVAMNVARTPPEPPKSLLPTPASSRPSSPTPFTPSSHPYISKAQFDHRYAGAGSQSQYQPTTATKQEHLDHLPITNVYSPRSQQSNLSTVRSYRQRDSVILQEQAPFTVNSSESSFHDNIDFPSRLSTDEEHPFEHWYRGEVSRNGGVGELRVANRKEMLDIANYGHVLRQHTSRPHNLTSTIPHLGGRSRPDSISARGSFYLEDYDVSHANTVLDEMPLTDLDVDTETDHDTTYTHYDVKQTSTENTPIPTTVSRLTPPSRLPTPARNHGSQDASSSQATEEHTRGLSSPPDLAPTLSHQPRSAVLNITQPQSLSAAQKVKRGRTKSPPASVNKKAKVTQYKRSKSAIDVRRRTDVDIDSPMEFPDGMADAIPSWTQPIPKTGNWDDVVLPVVARKMGLEDQYMQADGSPRPQKAEEVIPPPAPGTFGFDHSKYKRAMDAVQQRKVASMDEFGQYPQSDEKIYAKEMIEKEDTLSPLNTNLPSFQLRETAPPSPAPFSHYAPLAPEPVIERPRKSRFVDDVEAPSTTVERVESAAGCCRGCVIM